MKLRQHECFIDCALSGLFLYAVIGEQSVDSHFRYLHILKFWPRVSFQMVFNYILFSFRDDTMDQEAFVGFLGQNRVASFPKMPQLRSKNPLACFSDCFLTIEENT